MSLATEKRKLSSMPFLHVQVICENRELATSVYRKPTFGGVDPHFENIFF